MMTHTPIDITGRIRVDKEESEESESSDEEPPAAEPQRKPKATPKEEGMFAFHLYLWIMAWMTLSVDGLDGGEYDYFFLQQMSPLSAQKQPEPEEEAEPEPQTEKKRKKAGAAFFDRMAEGAAKKGAKKWTNFFLVKRLLQQNVSVHLFPFLSHWSNFHVRFPFCAHFFICPPFCWPNCFLDLPNTIWNLMLDILDLLDLWKKFLPVFFECNINLILQLEFKLRVYDIQNPVSH